MGIPRIAHDSATNAATKLADDLRGLVMESEQRDLWELLYDRIKAALESGLIVYQRELLRLNPLN